MKQSERFEILASIDELFAREKFADVDQMLQKVNVPETDLFLLTGYLRITNPYQEELPHYPVFFAEIKKTLLESGVLPEEPLAGLEPIDPTSSYHTHNTY